MKRCKTSAHSNVKDTLRKCNKVTTYFALLVDLGCHVSPKDPTTSNSFQTPTKKETVLCFPKIRQIGTESRNTTYVITLCSVIMDVIFWNYRESLLSSTII